jgi:hypothetical protein
VPMTEKVTGNGQNCLITSFIISNHHQVLILWSSQGAVLAQAFNTHGKHEECIQLQSESTKEETICETCVHVRIYYENLF